MAKLSKIIILCAKWVFSPLTTHVLIKKCKKWFAPAFYRVKTPFFGQKCPYFGQIKAFLSNFWHWTPKILQYVHKFCWCMGFQVKILIGFDGEGFWVQKKLSRAIWKSLFLPEIQVLKLFWPPIPIFSPKVPSKYPHMMIGHVVGPHCYLYKVPGSLNIPIVTIFLDPTCQSWPQMSPISAKIMIYVQNLFFPNSSNPNRKIFNGPSLRKHLYCSIGTHKIIILAHLRPTLASWV